MTATNYKNRKQAYAKLIHQPNLFQNKFAQTTKKVSMHYNHFVVNKNVKEYKLKI